MRQHPLPRRITVMVVEDHPEFRDTLSRVVSDSEDMRLLGACKDLPAGLCLLEQHCLMSCWWIWVCRPDPGWYCCARHRFSGERAAPLPC
ncbi:hypothetical protein Y695_03139 [Hydrogenophaga sp. T4]|nr:hypothetical protein Y695_03139 [Hydrogenophaga sp. T4]